MGFPVSDKDIRALKIKLLSDLAACAHPPHDLPTIAMKHGLTVDDAKALAQPHGWPVPKSMGAAAAALRRFANGEPPADAANPATPVAPAAPSAPRPAANGTDQMIATGEKSGKARTRRLAKKIREDLAELRGLVIAERKEAEAAEAEAEKAAQLREKAADLERQLAEVRTQLRGGKPAANKGPGYAAEVRAIRAWAAENGVDCPAYGRLPTDVRMAYQRAQVTEGEA